MKRKRIQDTEMITPVKKAKGGHKEIKPPTTSRASARMRIPLPKMLPTKYDVEVTTPPLGRPSIHNVLATVKVGCKLDLKKICTHCRNAEFNPRRFNAVVMRIQDPKSTAVIWESGTLCINGTKSQADSHKAARKFCKILQGLGFDAKFRNYKTCNVLGKIDLRVPIHLEELAFANKDIASYEPELFPAVVIRLTEPKVTVFVFVSGNIVFTGCRSEEVVNEAFRLIFEMVIVHSFQPDKPKTEGKQKTLKGKPKIEKKKKVAG